MPLRSDSIEPCRYARMLVMGPPKIGKTQTTISTAPPGGVYVINCDDKFSLVPAARVAEFEYDNVLGPGAAIFQQMENAIIAARTGVAAGRYKTVIWDTITLYARTVEDLLLGPTPDGKVPDGRRAWPEYEKRVMSVVSRLFQLDAHVIVTAHYIDVKGALIRDDKAGIEQLEKTGDGICPLLAGKARATIPAMFSDVLFFEKRGADRFFVTSSEGVWGPGCRNLQGVSSVPANVASLWDLMTDSHAKSRLQQAKKEAK